MRAISICPLFTGIGDDELDSLLLCLNAATRQYAKDAVIFMEGGKADSVGVVLTGSANIVQEDFFGNRMILARVSPGGLFGEAFSCAGTESLPVSVFAAEKSEIMLIDYKKIVSTCPSACTFHARLIQNTLRVLAEKNIMLTRKMECLSKRTLREKLLCYLSQQAGMKGGAVEIPFNRQELADYLCVDRSALSRELGVMRNEGLISFERNRFEIIQPD